MTGNHKRYYIYKIKRDLDTTGKFYIMPNKIDPFDNGIKTINIAEGVFDILGIFGLVKICFSPLIFIKIA